MATTKRTPMYVEVIERRVYEVFPGLETEMAQAIKANDRDSLEEFVGDLDYRSGPEEVQIRTIRRFTYPAKRAAKGGGK